MALGVFGLYLNIHLKGCHMDVPHSNIEEPSVKQQQTLDREEKTGWRYVQKRKTEAENTSRRLDGPDENRSGSRKKGGE